MGKWIALFRGINVGGNNIIKMAELKNLAGRLGFQDAATYIQSGNLVFGAGGDAATIWEKLADGVEETFGFKPDVMVLSADELASAIAENPFPEGEEDPKTLHLYFLAGSSGGADIPSLEALKKPDSERFGLRDRVFYLHAPEGIGRSKLAAGAEKLLGVPATARNWRTALKLKEMTESL